MLHSTFCKKTLLAVTLLMHPACTFTTMYVPVKNVVKKVSNALEDFFSKENNETYIAHYEKIKLILLELNTALDQLIKKDQTKYTKQVHALGKMVTKKLQEIVLILEKHKNTKPLFAAMVGKELTNACDVTQLFAIVKNQIIKLKLFAQKENNTQVITQLDELLAELSKIDNAWQSKGAITDLLPGLSHRMRQK